MDWMVILELAVLCSAVGYVAQTIVQKYTTPERTGLIFSLESVFAAVFGFFVLHEVLPVTGYIGTILILCGVVIAVLYDTPVNPTGAVSPERSAQCDPGHPVADPQNRPSFHSRKCRMCRRLCPKISANRTLLLAAVPVRRKNAIFPPNSCVFCMNECVFDRCRG